MSYDYYIFNETDLHNYSLYGDETWTLDNNESFIASSGIFSVNEQNDYGIFSSRKSSPVKKKYFLPNICFSFKYIFFLTDHMSIRLTNMFCYKALFSKALVVQWQQRNALCTYYRGLCVSRFCLVTFWIYYFDYYKVILNCTCLIIWKFNPDGIFIGNMHFGRNITQHLFKCFRKFRKGLKCTLF